MPNYLNKVPQNDTSTPTLTNLNDAATINFRHTANGGIGIYIDDQGNWTGTVTFEATRADVNKTWFAILTTSDTTGTASTTATTKGGYYCNVVGVSAFRVRLSTAGSNTALVTLVANPG